MLRIAVPVHVMRIMRGRTRIRISAGRGGYVGSGGTPNSTAGHTTLLEAVRPMAKHEKERHCR